LKVCVEHRHLLGAFDSTAHLVLRERIAATGDKPPDHSFKNIDWHCAWAAWRVQLPYFCGGGISYFPISDYGGPEAALIQAQYHRDEAYERVGVDVYARVRSSHRRVNEGKSLLAITEVMDRNTQTILGCWMETVDGQAKQRKVKRAFGALRSRDEAWAQVEAIVREKVAEEAQRRRVLAEL
jgi:hypothetical protein